MKRVAVHLDAAWRDKVKAEAQRVGVSMAEIVHEALSRYFGSPLPPKPPSGANALIASYVEAFKARYECSPIIDGRAAAAARDIVRAVPLENVQLLVQAYLQMDDKWFVQNAHSLPVFAQNLSKVKVALENGTQDPQERYRWKQIFKGVVDESPRLQIANGTTGSELWGGCLSAGEVEGDGSGADEPPF